MFLKSPTLIRGALAAVLLACACAPAWAGPSPEQITQAVDRYLALREVAFSTHSEDVEVKATPGQEQVYGVIVEYQVENGLVTVVGFASGDASVYRSTGGGEIGGRREPTVAGAARSLVAQAQVQLSDLPLVKDYPTPEPGHVRVYALTTAGLRGAEEARDDINDPRDRLAALFSGGRKIVSEFQAVER
ncbi:MAG: hypothetical protein ACXWKO_05675 [Phenylobacterium sp.]